MRKRRFRGKVGRRRIRLQRLETRHLLAGDAPLPVDDVHVAKEDTVVVIDVLPNDSDPEGDALSIVDVGDGSFGEVINNGGASVTYSPTAGFLGTDTFTYTVSDGQSQSVATVRVTVNEMFDGEAARDAILAGVTTLADPVQPAHMVAFGPTAFSVANYPGEDTSVPAVIASTMGSGRVIAMGDHQYLNMNSYGDAVSMAPFYNNSIGWLSETTSRSIKIVTHRVQASTWLAVQGYTNVVEASASSLAGDLVDADVLIAWPGGFNPNEAVIDSIEQFTKEGGGLFVVDYGIGYQWWWGKETPEIPGNRLLRDAGIGFVKDWPKSGTQAITRGIGQVTADDVLAGLRDSSGLTAAEKEELAGVYRKLNEVLPQTDSLQARLDAEFASRINQINPTPATPVSDPFDQTLLRREMDLIRDLPPDQVTAHRTVGDVYGDVPAEAARVQNHTVSVATDHSGYLPTGMYAPAGEVVTVEVPESLVGKGYQFRISGHTDSITPRSSWQRVPYGVSRTFPIESTTVDIAGAFGGAIYVDVGGQAAGAVPDVGTADLVFSGAVEAPFFVLGVTSDQDWIDTIRLHPAPFAELVSDGVSVSLPSSQIRDLENPTELMTLWNDIVAFQDWIGGFDQTRTGPDRFNIDVQISVGYLHAGYPIQGPTSTGPGIVNFDSLTTSGNWGYFHELGHEMQRHPELGWGYDNPWTFSGDVEVTVNIFANAALELAAPRTGTGGWGYSAHADATMSRAQTTVSDASKPTFEQKDPYPFYFQLADGPWGWEAYRDVLSTYVDQQMNDPAQLPTDNTDEKDEWLIRWSTVTGHDLTRYMVDHWRLEVTSGALAEVAALDLPDWMPLALESSAGRVSVLPGESITLNYQNAGMGLDGVASLVSIGQPVHGGLVQFGNGIVQYSADPFFTGTDTFEVTYRSSVGNEQTFSVQVDVVNRGVLMERFDNVGGVTIAALQGSSKYPGAPDQTSVLERFEIPVNAADSYGVRTRAYLRAPATGEFTFWIASDDNGELWLSESVDPGEASRIANVPGWSSSRDWDKFSEQQSVAVSLVEGDYYYIEALMKEGGGSDNLAVAWSGPGIDGPTVIDGDYLTPFGLAPSAPQVESVIINDGQDQRSRLESLEVIVDGEVLIRAGAEPFSIVRRDTGQAVAFIRTDSVVAGRTHFRFEVAESLADANYELVIDASVIGVPGQRLDGDSDGDAGGDHHFGAVAADGLFQHYGDKDGDRDVDGLDYAALGRTFLRRQVDSAFDAAFDFDADGDVDGLDYARFAERFLRSLPW